MYKSSNMYAFIANVAAKFKIPSTARFWGSGFQRIPKSTLFPKGDKVEFFCREILPSASNELYSDDLGGFIQKWSKLERLLINNAQIKDPKVQSVLKAIDTLKTTGVINRNEANFINEIRQFRNRAVHAPDTVDKEIISRMTRRIRDINNALIKIFPPIDNQLL